MLVTGKHSCSVQAEDAQRWHWSGCVSSTIAGGYTDIGGHSVTIVASDGVMCISTLTTSSDGGSHFIELLLFSSALRLKHIHPPHTMHACEHTQSGEVCVFATILLPWSPHVFLHDILSIAAICMQNARQVKCHRRAPASVPSVLGGPGSTQSSHKALLIQSDR